VHAVAFDGRSGIVYSRTSGFWSIDDADRYLRDLGAELDAARRRTGRALTLIDARETQVQAPEVLARMAGIEKLILKLPGDRVAHVAGSMLLKRQVERMLTSDRGRAFTSIEQAEAWLLSDSEKTRPTA
jgi:hypothetical protein